MSELSIEKKTSNTPASIERPKLILGTITIPKLRQFYHHGRLQFRL
jgi:hypothetical protein